MWTSFAALALPLLTVTDALTSITRTGKYLYDPDGKRFSIKGVAYQPQGELAGGNSGNADNGGFPEPSSYIDPLSSPQNCTRDLPYLRQLGVNAVRVYSVNASLNHDECMSAMEEAGIYVLLDISLPLNGSIDRSNPSWNTNLLNEYIKTIDAFNKYENILGYNVGNEVVNLPANTNAAPYVKAAARDIKAYLKSIGSSALIGYAAVDGDPDFRNALAEYLTCGEEDVVVDLYGLNNYEWCGNSTLQRSGWANITSGFSDLTVATYMSEYGCIFRPPRIFNEVSALFSSPVSDVFSGGVAFSYFPTSDGYGMVTFSTDGNSVQTTDDFDRLAGYYNSTSTPTSPAQSAAATGTRECPSQSVDLSASTDLPPTPDEAVCDCVNQNAFACRVKASSANQPAIVGALTDFACSLLGETNASASCTSIGGDGAAGTYGQLSMCSPAIKLSYVMSAYYEANPLDTSCDFDGNATLSSKKPNTAQDASAAAASCLNQIPSGGVFTPTVTGTAAQHTASGGSASGASGASASASTSQGRGNRVIGGFGGVATGLTGVVVTALIGGYMIIQ